MHDYNKRKLSHYDAGAMTVSAAKVPGFSLLEVIVVIGIFSITAATALPHIFDWRHGLRLRAAANEVRGDLETAKARAIKENSSVRVEFFPAEGRYQLTCTDAAGSNVVIKDQSLPPGIRFAVDDSDYTFDSSSNKASFSSRGTATGGTLVLKTDKGKKLSIAVNFLGRIEVRN